MVRRRAMFFMSLIAVLCVSLAATADGPLSGSIEAHKVVNDEGRESFIDAKQVKPRDIIEYRLTYANKGAEPLQNVTVTDPIPSGTEYVNSTATRPATGAVEFSIDQGKTYHSWPVRYLKVDENGNEVWAEATPDMVTHIRWTIGGTLDPDTEITFAYRTVVK